MNASPRQSPPEPGGLDERTPLLAEAGVRSPLASPPSRDSVHTIATAAPRGDGINRRVWVSHFLSTWNARVFEFGSTLYLASLFPGTLLPLSLYALTRGLASILLASMVGAYIDRGNRLTVVRHSIIYQRVAVAASCALFYVLGAGSVAEERWRSGLLVVLCALGCVEKLTATMNTIAVERDWVAVITEGDTGSKLVLNSQMRRIDFFCKIVGPLFIALIDGESTLVAILVNLVMNILSIPVEYFSIARVYYQVPNLQVSKSFGQLPSAHTVQASESAESRGSYIQLPKRLWQNAKATYRRSARDTALYFRHRCFLPSISLALTYLTVLSFSGRMVAYLLSSGFTSGQIAGARTFSVLFEFLATWIAPWAIGRVGAIRAGLWMSGWQLFWLLAGVSVFWFFLDGEEDGVGGPHRPLLSAAGLVGGTILSRVGLAGFDLCASVIVQEEVEDEHRGAFSSVESAWTNTFELLSYVATMVFSRPDQFRWPTLVSLIGITGVYVLYATFVNKRRGHLLHLPGEKMWKRIWEQQTALERVGSGSHLSRE